MASPSISEFFKLAEMTIDQKHDLKTIRTANGNIQLFSMGALANDESISMQEEKYVELLMDVIEHGDWDCEYLILDLPAGSSDLLKAVTMIFEKELLGNLVVLQPAHLIAADRLLRWHEINGINVIGIIENMSGFECPECHKTYQIFGEGTANDLAKKYNVPILGVLPLSMGVRGAVKEKTSIGGPIGLTFDKIAKQLLTLKPQTPGFIQGIMAKGKDLVKVQVVNAFVSMLKIANKEISITQIQHDAGYKGGRDIAITIFDDDFVEPLQTIYLILEGGKLKLIPEGAEPQLTINIKARALAGAMLGYIKYGNRKVRYNLLDAYLNGDMITKGKEGDALTVLKFITETWQQVQQVENGRVTKALELIL